MKYGTAEIIEAIENDDERRVLTYLYKTLLPQIQNHVLKNSGRKEDAYDIFQDAILVLYKYIKLGKFDANRDVEAFVVGVSHKLWLNVLKKKKRQTKLIDFSEYDAGIDIENDVISKERESILKQLFAELGERCRDLLVFTFFNDYSLAQITKLMGFATENAVKTKRYKCKQRLVEIISKSEQYKFILQKK